MYVPAANDPLGVQVTILPFGDTDVVMAFFIPSALVRATPIKAGATFSLKVRIMVLGGGTVESAAGIDLVRSVCATAGAEMHNAVPNIATASARAFRMSYSSVVRRSF